MNYIINKKGISLVAVTFVMLLTAVFSLFISSLISTKSVASVINMQAQQALYLAEAGMEWYKKQLDADSDWSTPPALKTNEAFGAGEFSVTYSNASAVSIDVTSTGKVNGWDSNIVQRVITQHIEKAPDIISFKDFVIFFGGGNGTITTSIERNGNFTGDIFIHGDIDTGRNCSIIGDISSTGTITLGTGTSVSGNVDENASFPALQPTLTTTYYDNLITTAEGQPAGNRTFNNETISGIIYVNGDIVIKNSISGSGTIIAAGFVDIKGTAVINDSINIISNGNILIRQDAVIGKSALLYSSSSITINRNAIIASGAGAGEGTVILSPGDIVFSTGISLTGFVFGDDVSIGGDFIFTGNLCGNRLQLLAQRGNLVKDDTKVDYGNIEGFESGVSDAMITSLWKESL